MEINNLHEGKLGKASKVTTCSEMRGQLNTDKKGFSSFHLIFQRCTRCLGYKKNIKMNARGGDSIILCERK
jgi:hypothetical protein